MRKVTIIIFLIITIGAALEAQNFSQNTDTKRTISIVGSATLNVIPDEIVLFIGLEEYWEEQLLPNTNKDDYNTKVSIDKIEDIFFERITKIGIHKDSIILVNTGRKWLWISKSVIYRNYSISVRDFKIADEILYVLNFHGINAAQIYELKNKDIPEYRKEVKKQAMLAAQNKAIYLLEIIDEELGRLISVRERSHERMGSFNKPIKSVYSNVRMGSSGNIENEDIFRSIPLRYEVEAVYEIKQ